MQHFQSHFRRHRTHWCGGADCWNVLHAAKPASQKAVACALDVAQVLPMNPACSASLKLPAAQVPQRPRLMLEPPQDAPLQGTSSQPSGLRLPALKLPVFEEASYEGGDAEQRISAEVQRVPTRVSPVPQTPQGFGRPLSSGPQLPASCSAQSIASYRCSLSLACWAVPGCSHAGYERVSRHRMAECKAR